MRRFGTRRAVSGLGRVVALAGVVVAFTLVELPVAPPVAAAGTWTITPSPNTSTSDSELLARVSCTSPSFCMAVGAYSGTSTGNRDQTLTETYDGTDWSIVPSPNASDFDDLIGVSCADPSSCVAVGAYFSNANLQTLVEEYDGTGWAIVPSPNTSDDDQLLDVSCASASFCVAVGNDQSSGYEQTLIEMYDGTNWSVASSPNTSTFDGDNLGAVTCSSPSACVAVGDYSGASTNDIAQTLVETYDGASWTITPSPNTSINDGNLLGGVSCVSASSCVAVGASLSSGSELTLVESYDGTSWTIAPSPSPSTFADALQGVSCVSASSCVAVGATGSAAGNDQTLIESYDGTSWSVVASPNASAFDLLVGVSCTTFCQAVGEYETAGGNVQTLVETDQAAAPDLSVGNAAPSSVASGASFHYTVTVTNSGGDTATSVTATDTLPASVHFDSVSTTNGTCTRTTSSKPKTKGGIVTCELGDLRAGDTATITIAVHATTPGKVSSTASASNTNVTPDADDTATVETTVTGS